MNITFLLFIAAIVANQMLMARAQRTLNTEQKALVGDVAANQHPWFYIVLAALYGAWMLAFDHMKHARWLLPAFIAVMFALSLGWSIMGVRRLSRLALPAPYIRAAWLGLAALQGGIVAAFGGLFYDFSSKYD